MKIYISASWKNRVLVRKLAKDLRAYGYPVFDFTDPACRRNHETPPEMFPEQFDPAIHNYSEYLNCEEWKAAVYENREAIADSDLIILILPCGIDATADWALGVGMGKRSIIVGQPPKGERSEVHLWADKILNSVDEIIPWLEFEKL
ncbi:MAG: hypothetical protein APF84_09275 [Gracilibacter sp. BRH_c7a]|nr:MAG: hypothetical protein APF84_09275 [Gracilibacter sp. BRH_c7a]